MIIEINENIKIWREYAPFDLKNYEASLESAESSHVLARMGLQKERIAIRNRWFDVLSASELIRKRNPSDGYYRAIYIQINFQSGEYYIGKVNRTRWSELKRYQGSGLKFVSKFKKNRAQFARYYLAACETAEETEQLEASIVDSTLLADEKCLNLVAGGGGTANRPSVAETSAKKREYMKNHPEQFRPMLEASRRAFGSGDTPALRQRSRRIKEVMSHETYRKMSAVRLKKWKEQNPLMYAAARRKNHEAIKTIECREKRTTSLKKWKSANPDKHFQWEQNRLEALKTVESKEKRKASLKAWREKNPEQAKLNAEMRAKSAAAKLSKEVCMIDLNSGEVLRRFSSQHEAARWLVETGKAKNTNCVSSINSVCLRKPCSTGYGYRKKAYGYGWRFSSNVEAQQKFLSFDM